MERKAFSKRFSSCFIFLSYFCAVSSLTAIKSCGWPDQQGICRKNCPNENIIEVNYVPENSPYANIVPGRCEKILEKCCKSEDTPIQENTCQINNIQGICTEARLCENILRPNKTKTYGQGLIEPRIQDILCKSNLVCCAPETISCEIDGKEGYCTNSENCKSKSTSNSANFGAGIIEERKSLSCKKPKVCCPKTLEVCEVNGVEGICKENCENILVKKNLGEGLLEERKGPTCKKPKVCCGIPTGPRQSLNSCRGICSKSCTNLPIADNNKETECADDEICCSSQVINKKCGQPTSELTNRVFGGTATTIVEHPWLVQITRKLEIKNKTGVVYLCAGALINSKVILTAAHCVEDYTPETLFVRAGVYNVHKINPELPHQNRNVHKKIIHEKFDRPSHVNNVALLILDRDFELGVHIRTICLPPAGLGEISDDKCIVAGWGKTGSDIASNYSEIPKKIELKIIPRKPCQNSLRQTKLGSDFELHESFICAQGDFGEDACKGDGGAPLVCPYPDDPSRYYEAGIVSWGIGCGENPGVYVNVAKYSEWVEIQLEKEDVDSDSYTFFN